MADQTRVSENRIPGFSGDEQIRAMFMRDSQDIADEGFSSRVIYRIRQRRIKRRWVLGAAGLVGLGLAWQPLKVSFLHASMWIQQTATGMSAVDWTSYTVMAGAGLAMMLIPVLTRAFGD